MGERAYSLREGSCSAQQHSARSLPVRGKRSANSTQTRSTRQLERGESAVPKVIAKHVQGDVAKKLSTLSGADAHQEVSYLFLRKERSCSCRMNTLAWSGVMCCIYLQQLLMTLSMCATENGKGRPRLCHKKSSYIKQIFVAGVARGTAPSHTTCFEKSVYEPTPVHKNSAPVYQLFVCESGCTAWSPTFMSICWFSCPTLEQRLTMYTGVKHSGEEIT